MEKDVRKKLVIPFITCLGFIAVSVNSVYRGIGHHETWRIVMASAGGAFFLTLIILVVRQVVKEGRNTA